MPGTSSQPPLPPARAMTDPEILDPTALDRLREWGGDKLLGQMIRLFLDNSPTRMDQIRAAVNGGEIRDAERAAHSLKSTAANLGAEELRALAAELEAVAATRDPHATRACLAELERAHVRAVSALESIEEGMGT
ncbi:MAG TPA: Hpt domain-containing protein [Longimicrobiales bacterium]|nr:Hpt domain-containing protein [Longimicrobiales bacterium]